MWDRSRREKGDSCHRDTDSGVEWDGTRRDKTEGEGWDKVKQKGWHDMARAKTKGMEYMAWHERRQDKRRDRTEQDKMGNRIGWDGRE